MSERLNAIADSIIRCEGLTFALASLPKQSEGSLREARQLLKKRLMKELMEAESRGAHNADKYV